MTETVRPRAHPLFDPGSLYRLGSELSVWYADRDGKGAASVRRFFEALRLQQLESDWRDATREALGTELNYSEQKWGPARWDWGHDEETNRRITQQRLARPRPTEPAMLPPPGDTGAEPRLRPVRTRGAIRGTSPEDVFALPGLLKYDLRGPAPVRLGDSQVPPADAFTGASATERVKEIESFEVNLDLGKQFDGCSCLVLLLSRGLVEQLAGLLAAAEKPGHRVAGLPRQQVRTVEEAADAVTRALAPGKLEPDRKAPREERWLASRLSLVLSCAAGLGGTVKDDHFRATVHLSDSSNRHFPHLPGPTWVVACLGMPSP
jgi:hypothetical protein